MKTGYVKAEFLLGIIGGLFSEKHGKAERGT